jgi:hypothetical protein
MSFTAISSSSIGYGHGKVEVENSLYGASSFVSGWRSKKTLRSHSPRLKEDQAPNERFAITI